MRMSGIEPPRCHHHRLLRPARLPVPPHPLVNGENQYTEPRARVSSGAAGARKRGFGRKTEAPRSMRRRRPPRACRRTDEGRPSVSVTVVAVAVAVGEALTEVALVGRAVAVARVVIVRRPLVVALVAVVVALAALAIPAAFLHAVVVAGVQRRLVVLARAAVVVVFVA